MIHLTKKDISNVNGGCYWCGGNYGTFILDSEISCKATQCRTLNDENFTMAQMGGSGPEKSRTKPCHGKKLVIKPSLFIGNPSHLEF